MCVLIIRGISISASLLIVRLLRSMILQLQSERSIWHEHNPEIIRHRGPDMYRGPRMLTPYYRRASGCDRQEDIGAFCDLRVAPRCGESPGMKRMGPLNLYTDRKSRE